MSRYAALALALVLLVRSAAAQPTDVTKADALFREGRALMKSGNYEKACPKLEESYRLDPAAGTGINLGDCFEKQGKVASALLAYQAARGLLQPGDPRIGPVVKEISALGKRTPRLTIKLAAGAPDGTTVKRDGREIEASKLGVPVVVNPGKVKVVVSAPGRESAVFLVTLGEGQAQQLAVDAGDAHANDLPARPRASPPRVRDSVAEGASGGPSQSTVGFVVGGVSLAVLGAGAAFWAQSESKYDEADCDAKCPRDSPLADEADRARSTATWLGAVGAGGLAAGIVIVLTSPSNGDAAARLRVAPRLMVGGAGAQVGAVW